MSSNKSESDSLSDTGSVKASDGIENSSNLDGFNDNVEHMYDYDDDEIDEIGDKDTTSVGTSLPHGKSRESEKIMSAKVMELEREVSAKSVELEENEVFNIEDAMIAAEERIKRKHDAMSASATSANNRNLTEKNSFSIMKVILGLAGGICVLVIIGVSFKFGQNSIEKNEGDKGVTSIKEKESLSNFSNGDEDMMPTGAATTDAGNIENKISEMGEDEEFENLAPWPPETGTSEAVDELNPRTPEAVDKFNPRASETDTSEGLEAPLEIMSILETEIHLRSTTIFPRGIKEFLLDITEPGDVTTDETQFFWMIPFAGDVFQSLMTACSRKILASNHWLATDDTMRVFYDNHEQYVNVNLFTNEGIVSAADKGLAASKLADVFVSNQVDFPTNKLFDENYKGRLFTAVRHPVDRAIAMYHRILESVKDPVCETLEGCLSSQYMAKNWITRVLISKRDGGLVQEDLNLAKEILRTRCLIGLYEEIDLSMALFKQYFGWTMDLSDDNCKEHIIRMENERAMNVAESIGMIDGNSDVYKKIVNLNSFDMELYLYASELFNEQQRRYLAQGA